MSQRSRKDITYLILQAAEKGATKTVLMYETYLSHNSIVEYVDLLIADGLLEYLTGEMKFKTTSKGLSYLTLSASDGCSHQCNKCGVLYKCKHGRCQDPFFNALCTRCLDFNGHEVRDIAVNISIPAQS